MVGKLVREIKGIYRNWPAAQKGFCIAHVSHTNGERSLKDMDIAIEYHLKYSYVRHLHFQLQIHRGMVLAEIIKLIFSLERG